MILVQRWWTVSFLNCLKKSARLFYFIPWICCWKNLFYWITRALNPFVICWELEQIRAHLGLINLPYPTGFQTFHSMHHIRNKFATVVLNKEQKKWQRSLNTNWNNLHITSGSCTTVWGQYLCIRVVTVVYICIFFYLVFSVYECLVWPITCLMKSVIWSSSFWDDSSSFTSEYVSLMMARNMF